MTHRSSHRMSKSPEYVAYQQAKGRCTNPSYRAWPQYGGRGIQFKFTSFEEWLKELGPRPSPLYSVDRKDNDGPYAPGNVRWSTKREQQLNRRRKPYVIDPKIAELYAQGIGTPTIAKMYGIRREAIRKKLVSAGIPRRPRRKDHESVVNRKPSAGAGRVREVVAA